MNSRKYKRKKINFINRLEYAEVKIFSICVDLYQICESDNYDEIYKILSTLKNKQLKINNKLIEIYKDMLKNPNFEQNKYSLTSTGIYKSIYREVFVDILLRSHNYSYMNID